ncbi:hypothetical protein ZIOFF_064627 [Zingiber officinale]|uniref:Thioredoxin domain-containing protein n=1 Tax=Zingiber officinale TaxID=94328 RepID=A0A8J5EYP0_ZINOF|nr:hypothetical protein ZIOFF_064627 [Zingiber officinale]
MHFLVFLVLAEEAGSPIIQSHLLTLMGNCFGKTQDDNTANNPTGVECGPSKALKARPEQPTSGTMVPWYSKMEFPTYSGEGDPLDWVKRALEQKQCFHRGEGRLRANWGRTTTELNMSSGGSLLAKTKTMGDISKETPPALFFKRLTRAEMAEWRAKGLCFNCDESYSTSYKCKCMFWIEVPNDDREGEEEGEVNPEISLYAISGEGKDADLQEEVDFKGGNVHVITSQEGWDQKISQAKNDGKIDYDFPVVFSFVLPAPFHTLPSRFLLFCDVVANFSATWCGPCRLMAPVYTELSEKYPALMFLTIDVDKLSLRGDAIIVRGTLNHMAAILRKKVDRTSPAQLPVFKE